MLTLGRVKNDNRILLIIGGARNMKRRIETIVFDYFHAGAMLRELGCELASGFYYYYPLSPKTFSESFPKA